MTDNRETYPPMERRIFVSYLFMAGAAFGAAVVSGLVHHQWGFALGFAVIFAFAAGYTRWRLKESGWPK